MKKLICFLILSLSICRLSFAAVTFDGTDDIICADNPTGLPSAHPITVTAWIYPTTLGDDVIISHDERGPTTGWFFQTRVTGAELRYGTRTVKDYNTTAMTVVENVWQFVAVSVDSGDDATFYHLHTGTGTWTSETITHTADMVAPDSSADLKIGAGPGTSNTTCAGTMTSFWDGQLGPIHLYSTNLSEAQIHSMGNSRLHRYVGDWSNIQFGFELDTVADGVSADAVVFRPFVGTQTITGIDGANNTGLTGTAQGALSYY